MDLGPSAENKLTNFKSVFILPTSSFQHHSIAPSLQNAGKDLKTLHRKKYKNIFRQNYK